MATSKRGSFFTHLTADEIWEGVSAVSQAGKKRGRGKRGDTRKKVDLNRGQLIGTGKSNMVWPGLNTSIIKGKEVVQRQQLPPDPTREEQLINFRQQSLRTKRQTVPPLQRGWSGFRLPGQSIGPPDPIGQYTFEGFETRVLEYKIVSNMTGNMGRKQQFSCFVVTGNGKGLAGFGLGKAPSGKAAIRKAKNVAAQKLQYFDLFEDHTVWHDFYAKEGKTSVRVQKSGKGYGFVCHRAVKTISEAIGIKNLYAKVEGSTKNIQNLTKAFFAGLRSMETHQQLADRVSLNVVEFRGENDYFPKVVARPKVCRADVDPEEDLDFSRIYFGGKVPYIRAKKPAFYEKYLTYRKKTLNMSKFRNQAQVQIMRKAAE